MEKINMEKIKRRMEHWFFEDPPLESEIYPVLNEAAEKGDAEALKYLLEHKKIHKYLKSRENIDNLLGIAFLNSRKQAAEYLISIGAKVGATDLDRYKNPEMFDMAMEHLYTPRFPHEVKALKEAVKSKNKRKIMKKISVGNAFLNYSKGEIGGAVWSQTMGDFYRTMGRNPFSTHADCMTKTYTDKDDIKRAYTKDQLYFIAKGMGLSVKRDMNKDELCGIIVYSS
jgi:hypothetical protein